VAAACFACAALPLPELARSTVSLDHVASFIVNETRVIADRMAAHRRLDRRPDDFCLGESRKCACGARSLPQEERRKRMP